MSATRVTPAADDGDLFDFGQGKIWVGFVARSLRRHWIRAGITFVVIAGLLGFLALAGNKEWATSSQLIARNDSVLNGLLIGGNATSERPEPPATLAETTMKAQANLEKVVDDLKLVDSYRVNENKLARAKRKLMEKVFGPTDVLHERNDIVNILRTKVVVTTSTTEQVKQTINVSATWIDPILAQKIVAKLDENFLADRRAAEVGPVEDSLELAQQAKDDADKQVAQLRFDLNVPETSDALLPESSPLKPALGIQAALGQRIVDLRLQLANTQQVFTYRYKIVTPPDVPRAPVAGHLKSLFIAIMGGAILATFVSVSADVLRGRIVEPWQTSRAMNLPLLAELPN